jgi:hypothetical protein
MINLTYESWDNIFTDNDVNTIFNNFLHTYLRNFYSSFPLITSQYKPNKKVNSIKTSCLHKREIYLISRNTNNSKLREHYKSYCKILSHVINAAKKLNHNQKVSISNNLNITKTETCKKLVIKVYTHLINTNGKLTNNYQTIEKSFNTYLLKTADKIISNNTSALLCQIK